MQRMRELKQQQRQQTAQASVAPKEKKIGDGVPTKELLIQKHGGYTPELN